MRSVGRNQVYLIEFLLKKIFFHLEIAAFLLRLGNSRRLAAQSGAFKRPRLATIDRHWQLLREIAVIEDNLFASFHCVLSVETKTKAF